MLGYLLNFGFLIDSVRVESHDLISDQQTGLRDKYPRFDREFKIACLLSAVDREKLREAGFSTDYNNLCRE